MLVNEATFVITAHERPDTCRATIDAIKALYPGAHILVADSSETTSMWPDVTMIPMEHDAGISEKRNTLAAAVETPYLVMMDDDNLLVEGQTNLQAMLDILKANDRLTIVGHRKHDFQRQRWSNFEADLTIKSKKIRTHKPSRRGKSEKLLANLAKQNWWQVDQVPMCFVARTSTFSFVRFDDRMKTCGEHIDFFLRLAIANGNQALKMHALACNSWVDGSIQPWSNSYGHLGVGFYPGSMFQDTGARPSDTYNIARKRGKQYRRLMMRNWQVDGIKQWNSKVKKKVRYV